jgi:hypothetical protein
VYKDRGYTAHLIENHDPILSQFTGSSDHSPSNMLYRLALVAMAGLAAATEWSGSGQIRAMDSDDRTKDVGCLTADGQWTSDESLCGTFTATQLTSAAATVSSTAGNCYIPFQCASDNSAFTYTVSWATLALLLTRHGIKG